MRRAPQILTRLGGVDTATQATARDLGSIGAIREASKGIAEAVETQGQESRRIAAIVADASAAASQARREAERIAASASRGVGMADDLAAWTTQLQAAAERLRLHVDAFARDLKPA